MPAVSLSLTSFLLSSHMSTENILRWSLFKKLLLVPSAQSRSHSKGVYVLRQPGTQWTRLAKIVCGLPRRDAMPSLPCYLSQVHAHTVLAISRDRDSQRAHSVSIQHYDSIRHHRYEHCRRGLRVRRQRSGCPVTPRLQTSVGSKVARLADASHFTSCRLCDAPNCIHLQQYCLHCTVVQDTHRDHPLVKICRHLLSYANLDTILIRDPCLVSAEDPPLTRRA